MYKNFSEWYKDVMLKGEETSRQIWYKNLHSYQVFLELLKKPEHEALDLFNQYWIDSKLFMEIVNSTFFEKYVNNDKWEYIWISDELKEIMINSVKIAASFNKAETSEIDFLLALFDFKDCWIYVFLDYVWISANEFKWELQKLNKTATKWDMISDLENIINNISKNLWISPDNITFNAVNSSENNEISDPFSQNLNNKNSTTSKTPALDFFGTDLCAEVKKENTSPVIWRDTEIDRLIAILNRKTKNNPCLVWEPWVWKTAIVEWLAQKIVAWKVPLAMQWKRIIMIEMSWLVAWTKYRWEFESRLKQIIDEASAFKNNIILFIDEIHTMIWAWSWEWTLDAANILKPAMWRWKITLIWATTHAEFEKHIEKDSALERRFQKIVTEEPTKEIAIKILTGIKKSFEDFHNLLIDEDAIEAAVKIWVRYIPEKQLPDKAIDLIDEACSMKSMAVNPKESKIQNIQNSIEKNQKDLESFVVSWLYHKAIIKRKKIESLEKEIEKIKEKKRIPLSKRLHIKETDIEEVASMMTWIPLKSMQAEDRKILKQLEKNIKTEIFWQDDAIKKVVRAIRRSKVWISDENKPIGSFLFLWPTWVWKTELVKVLAKEFYQDDKSLIKIDMSEFTDKSSTSKLLWTTAWYVWYEEWWLLTDRVRKKPYSVILFDEIEKANPEVFNLLLQILDEWTISDGHWRDINFKNTIVILTSNIWSEEFNESAEQIWFDLWQSEVNNAFDNFEKIRDKVINELDEYFSPEFLNRIDSTIVFNPLDKKILRKIIILKLDNLVKKLANKNIKITYTNKIVNFINKEIFNPSFGARPVNRFIADHIEDLIALKILNSPNTKNIDLDVVKWEIKIV